MKNKTKYLKFLLSSLLFVFILYSFIVFYLLTNNYSYRFIGIIFSLFIIIKFITTRSIWQFIIGLFLALSIVIVQKDFFLKIYPCLMNFSFFLIFYSNKTTSFMETSTQKITDFFHIKTIPSSKYLLKCKKQWSIFMFINTLVSITTLFTPLKIWTIYNGLISYILIGCMFVYQFISYHLTKKNFLKL